MNLKHAGKVMLAAVTTISLVLTISAPALAVSIWTPLHNRKFYPFLMAVRGGVSAGPGAELVLWEESHKPDGSLMGDQQWRFEQVGDSNEYIIRNAGTSYQYALSIQGNTGANGTPVVQWWYQAGNAYERWQITEYASNVFQISSLPFHNACLAVEGGGHSSISEGARLILWKCGEGQDQQWFHDDIGI